MVAAEHDGRIFHLLRPMSVRNLVRGGVTQSTAMKISGHKTASMFRRYDICSEDDLRQAAEMVARYHEAAQQKVLPIAQQGPQQMQEELLPKSRREAEDSRARNRGFC
jgi:hypothetical protein